MFSRDGVGKKLVLAAVCGAVMAGLSLWGCGRKREAQERSPHYRKAVEAYHRGDYARAVSYFVKATRYEPSNAEMYLDIGAIYDDFLDDASKAISYYEKYLELADEGEKADWVRRWLREARKRLSAAPKPGESEVTEAESAEQKDQLIETLREDLRTANLALSEERKKTEELSDRITALDSRLSASLKKQKELQDQIAAYSRLAAEPGGEVGLGSRTTSVREGVEGQRRWLILSWVLCASLFVLVVALIIRQRRASSRNKALLAGIRASASGEAEQIQRQDVLGKYFWVENEDNAGVLSFTEKDDEIHVCAIDGTTRLRSRGKGELVGNVLTAELHSPGGESIITKFIFANKGRTVTAIWQGEESTSVAAGTKAVGD